MYVQMEELFGKKDVKVKDPATGQRFHLLSLAPLEEEEITNQIVAAAILDAKERSVRTQ